MWRNSRQNRKNVLVQKHCPSRQNVKYIQRDFSGSPEVKTWPSNASGTGLISGGEAKIPNILHTKKQNIKQKQYCDKFNKDFKNDLH